MNCFRRFAIMGVLFCVQAACSRSPEKASEISSPQEMQEKESVSQTTAELSEEGLFLPDAMQRAIGLDTAHVEKKALREERQLDFQVFREARERSLPALIYRHGSAYATARVEETAGFASGNSVEVDAGEFHATGRIVEIVPVPPASSHLWEILIAIPDPENRLRITQFVHASLLSSVPVSGLVVPTTSVLPTPEGTFVYRKEKGRFKKIAIEAVPMDRESSRIVKGLSEGDILVTTPVKTLWLTELQLRNEGKTP